jgi:hypothetical protein
MSITSRSTAVSTAESAAESRSHIDDLIEITITKRVSQEDFFATHAIEL